MVLINDKKYSCSTCIKGHRSGSCTHTDRPLFEIKKKGRPVTQCEHCRKLRSEKQLHIKCECAVKTPGSSTKESSPQAAFPNGLRDVHARNEAADALSSLGSGSKDGSTSSKKAKRLDALLNPCQCQSGGKCTCCKPVSRPNGKESVERYVQSPAQRSDLATNTSGGDSPGSQSTFSNRQVHKANFYSPYKNDYATKANDNRRRSLSRVTSGRSTPEPHIHHDRPITLPRIRESDSERAVDVSLPSVFPTVQSLDMDGCTCGEGCACPGCTTHPKSDENRARLEASGDMEGVQSCPSSCQSCFDCRGHVNFQPGLQSIQHLIDIAAASIPPPAQLRTPYTTVGSSAGTKTPLSNLDPLDTSVLSPVALWNDDAANAMGLVKLKPLECCNGRCQCNPGMCQCLDDCCGCCSYCACGPDPNEKTDAKQSANTPASPSHNNETRDGEPSCCAGGKGGNPSAAEIIEVSSDDQSVDGPDSGDKVNAGSSQEDGPLAEQVEALAVTDKSRRGSPEPTKSCCTEKHQGEPSSAQSKQAVAKEPSQDGAGKKGSCCGSSAPQPTGSSSADKSNHAGPSTSRQGTGKSAGGPRPILPRPVSHDKAHPVPTVRSTQGRRASMTDKSNASSRSSERNYPNLPSRQTQTVATPVEPQTDPPLPTSFMPNDALPVDNLFSTPSLAGAQFPFDPWTGLPNANFPGNQIASSPAHTLGPSSNVNVPNGTIDAIPSSTAHTGELATSLTTSVDGPMAPPPPSPEALRAAAIYLLQQQYNARQNDTDRSNAPPDSIMPAPYAFPLSPLAADPQLGLGPAQGHPPALGPAVSNVVHANAGYSDSFVAPSASVDVQDFGQLESMFQRYLQEMGGSHSQTYQGLGQVPVSPSVASMFNASGQMPQAAAPQTGTYPTEPVDTQQLLDGLSPRSFEAILSHVFGEQLTNQPAVIPGGGVPLHHQGTQQPLPQPPNHATDQWGWS